MNIKILNWNIFFSIVEDIWRFIMANVKHRKSAHVPLSCFRFVEKMEKHTTMNAWWTASMFFWNFDFRKFQRWKNDKLYTQIYWQSYYSVLNIYKVPYLLAKSMNWKQLHVRVNKYYTCANIVLRKN